MTTYCELRTSGFVSRNQLLEPERQLAEVTGRHGEDPSNIADINARLPAFRMRGRAVLRYSYRVSPTAAATSDPRPADTPLRLVFSGECIDGHNPQAVRRAIAAALKLDEARAARLFSGKRIVLRRQVDAVTAYRYIARFALMGAVLRAEAQPLHAPRAQAAAPQMSMLPIGVPPSAEAPAPVPPAAAPPSRLPAGPLLALPLWLRWTGGGVLYIALALVLGLVYQRGLDALWPDTLQPDADTVALGDVSPTRPQPAAPVVADAPAHASPAATAAPQPLGDADADVPPDMTPAALREYRQRYLYAPNHKAFAISGAGAHAWHGGAGSQNEAREQALAGCMRALGPGDDGCRIVDADGQWEE